MATLCEPAPSAIGPTEERDEEDKEEREEEGDGGAQPQKWTLTEEDVQREYEESVARTEAAKAHIRTQESVTLRINAKLTEHGEYDALAVSHGVSHGPPGSRGRGSKAPLSAHSGTASWPMAYLEGTGSPEQRHCARVVAEEMLRRQERVQKFAMRRKEVLEENEQLQAQTAKDLEAAESRCATRQRERLLESRRRAFAAQQRRAEQQKVLRENQREQERVWECYYQKKERQAKAAYEREKQAMAQQGLVSSVRMNKSKTVPDLAGWLDEEVYKTTLQSHQSYAETIERWRQFEKENERRTEAHKKKLLLSAGYSYSRTSIDDGEAGKGEKRLRGVKEGPRGKTIIMRRTSTTSESMGLAATAPLLGGDSPGALKMSTISRGSSMHSLRNARTLPSLGDWEAKRDMCVRHHEELDQRNFQKMQQKEECVQEARQRIQKLNRSRSERFGELNQTWKERNDSATQKRAEVAVATDDDMFRRLEEHTRRHDELARKRADQLAENSQARAERISQAQFTARSLQDKAQKAAQEKAQLKDETSQSNIQQKLKEFEEKASNQEYKDVAREKYQSKVSQQQEFQKKAEQEMELKDSRSRKALLERKQSALERCRSQKKERGSLSPSPTRRLSGQLSPVDSSPEASREASPGRTTTRCSLPALPGSAARRSPSRPADGPASYDPGAAGSAAQDPGSRQNVRAVLAAELQQQQQLGEDTQKEGQRGSAVSGLDSDDEGVFLKELETRSVKWLHELRSKKEKAAWKP